MLSLLTNNASLRERGVRPLGCGYKNPGGPLAPWKMCREGPVSGDGLSPNPTGPERASPIRLGMQWSCGGQGGVVAESLGSETPG